MTLVAPQPVASPAALPPRAPQGERRVLLRGVSWTTYQQLLRDIGDHRGVRLAFDSGSLEIMSPGTLHENVKTITACVVEMYAFLSGASVEGYGSWTLDREDLQKGVEPDECYYVSTAARIVGKQKLTLGVDPPPDLAIEVDISRPELRRESIYEALGVPELWRYDGERFVVFRRNAAGAYEQLAGSLELPGLLMEELNRIVHVGLKSGQTAAVAALVEWFNTRHPRRP